MSLREQQQMNLDTESATYTGMEGQSRSSHKYLLLQVWCGILTVGMVVMAAFLISIKPKSTEGEVSTQKPDNVNPTGLTVNMAHLRSTGFSPSFIQLIKSPHTKLWEDFPRCPSCSLVWDKDSINCTEDGFYFIYAQVTFSKMDENQTKSVVLVRDATVGKTIRILVEGTFPKTTEGTVWVSNIVSLKNGDRVSLNIIGDVQSQNTLTFWGAYKLH